uniref:Ubiquitin-like domain-containing protein n=1 Tax=Lates calcarifer TaxID=8187 RepID=A0A4W6CND8_LATCA
MSKGSVMVHWCPGGMKNIPLSNTKEQVQNTTVKELKKRVRKEFSIIPGLNVDDVQLSFKGQKLDNDCSPLSEYGIQHKSVLQLVWGLGA